MMREAKDKTWLYNCQPLGIGYELLLDEDMGRNIPSLVNHSLNSYWEYNVPRNVLDNWYMQRTTTKTVWSWESERTLVWKSWFHKQVTGRLSEIIWSLRTSFVSSKKWRWWHSWRFILKIKRNPICETLCTFLYLPCVCAIILIRLKNPQSSKSEIHYHSQCSLIASNRNKFWLLK